MPHKPAAETKAIPIVSPAVRFTRSLLHQKVTSPNFATRYAPLNTKTTIRIKCPQILRLHKAAGIEVCQVDQVHAARRPDRQAPERIVQVPHDHLHPRRRAKKPLPGRIGLRHQFCHSVFGMHRRHAERIAQQAMELFTRQLSRCPFIPPVSMTIVPCNGPGRSSARSHNA